MCLTIKKPYPFEEVKDHIVLEGSVNLDSENSVDHASFRIAIQTYPVNLYLRGEIPVFDFKKRTWRVEIRLNKDLRLISNPFQYLNVKVFHCDKDSMKYFEELGGNTFCCKTGLLPTGCKEVDSVIVVQNHIQDKEKPTEVEYLRDILFKQ